MKGRAIRAALVERDISPEELARRIEPRPVTARRVRQWWDHEGDLPETTVDRVFRAIVRVEEERLAKQNALARPGAEGVLGSEAVDEPGHPSPED
jgi:hypothetical protein